MIKRILFENFIVAALIFASTGFASVSAIVSRGYTLRLNNISNKKIIKVLATSDGSNFQRLEIGSGVKPGQAVDVSLGNTQECNWTIKAVYADTSESKPAQTNACQPNAAVAFE